MNPTIPLPFDKIPDYAAPEDVYRTARYMCTDRKIDIAYSLTWSFPVNSYFIYVVRLHFCEIQREICKIGDRVFEIQVNSQVADLFADDIRWIGGRGIPIYRECAVDIYAPMREKI